MKLYINNKLLMSWLSIQSSSTKPLPILTPKMAISMLLKLMFPLLFLSMIFPKTAYAEFELWCVADEQTTDYELQAALDWACGKGGADCGKIQVNQPCYLPNTLKDHASYAFNNYFQKFKHSGASCYFRGAAMTTEVDPSHGSCHYDFIP